MIDNIPSEGYAYLWSYLTIYAAVFSFTAVILGYYIEIKSWKYVDFLYYTLGIIGILLIFRYQIAEIERLNIARDIYSVDRDIADLRYKIDTEKDDIKRIRSRSEFGDSLVDKNSPMDVIEAKSDVWNEVDRFNFIAKFLPDPEIDMVRCIEDRFDEECNIINNHMLYLKEKFGFVFSSSNNWSYHEPSTLVEICEFVNLVDVERMNLDHCSGTPAWLICPVRIQLSFLEKRCSSEELEKNSTLGPRASIDMAYRMYLSGFNDQKKQVEILSKSIDALNKKRGYLETIYNDLSGWRFVSNTNSYVGELVRYHFWPYIIIAALCLKLGKAVSEFRKGSNAKDQIKAEGRAPARNTRLTELQRREALLMLAHDRSVREVAKVFGVHPSTISRLRKRNNGSVGRAPLHSA